MPKIRNVSPDELFVPVLGRSVQPDEVVEVGQDVFDAHAWPETTWAEVGTTKANKSKDEE